jgi:predicted enzyme related to lactoylglutathione lyase
MSNSEDMTTNKVEATVVGQDNNPAPGIFCWWELSTNDAAAAKSFYSNLFGWTPFDVPLSNGGVYTMLKVDGKDVAALHDMSVNEMNEKGIPPHWLSYIASSNVEETAQKVTANGGTLIVPPMDVMEQGRMLVLQDPTGAVVGVWESQAHKGAGHMNKVGGVIWNELTTSNTAVAGEFYRNTFGWTSVDQQMGDMTYTMFNQGENSIAGMMQIDPAWGEVPSNWMPYFWVADCDASVAQARELGAKVVMEPMEVEGVGRMCLLQDPQGAHFSIIKMAEMPS